MLQHKSRLRRFLTKLEKNPPRKLDSLAEIVEKDVWAETNCLVCSNCCREMTPTYTFQDIKRIAAQLGMTMKQFKEKWLVQDAKTGEWMNSSRPCQFLNRNDNMCTYLGHLVKLNNSAISAYFKDTSYVWLTFNDCATGRGYLLQLPFNKKESIRKMSSAINSFDKKFVVPEDLRAYADYSTIFVEDINTGKKEQMTFKEEYKIDWDNIHETIDSVNITRNRIFVQLKKDGQNVPLEKNISL